MHKNKEQQRLRDQQGWVWKKEGGAKKRRLPRREPAGGIAGIVLAAPGGWGRSGLKVA